MPELVLTKNGSNGHHKFTLTVTETSYSIEDNTSTVSFALTIRYISSTGWKYDWGTNNTAKYDEIVTIDGVTVTAHNGKYDGKSTTTYISGTQTIVHDTDGSKTISCSFSVDDRTGQTYTSGDASASGTLELTTIPRASTFTLSKTSGGTSTTSFTLGDSIYVNITRASTSFTHKVYFRVGSSADQVISNSAGTSANTTLATSLANYIPSQSGMATMYVETYNGTTLVGTKTQTFTINVPSSIVPTISSVTKTDTANLVSTYNAYVQGKSNLKVAVATAGAYSSTITNVTVNIKSGNTTLRTLTATYNSSTTKYETTLANISYTGTLTVEVISKDSRTRTATDTSTITVATYSNPSISTFTAERLNNDNVVTLSFSGSFTNINNSGTNIPIYKVYKRKAGTESWGNAFLTHTNSYTYNRTITENCDSNYGWEFKLEASDNFNTSPPITNTTDVGTAFELINWGSNGTSIAFGKVAEGTNSFECDLQTKFNKDTTILGNVIGGNIKIKNIWNNKMFVHNSTGGITTTTTGFNFTRGSETGGKYVYNTIPIESGKTYTMSLSGTASNIIMYSDRIYGTIIAQTTNDTLTFTSNYTGNVIASIILGSTVTSATITNIQFEEGNVVTTYTSYQGIGYENGNNTNGYYQKFDDGTLIQWGEVTFGNSGSTTDSYVLVTFPIRFAVEGYKIFAQPRYTGNISQNYSLATILTPSAGGVANNYIYRRLSYYTPSDTANQSQLYACEQPIYWYAIGRWK